MGIQIPIATKQKTSERRQFKRYIYPGDAEVRQLAMELSLSGRILDLSASGCLLEMPNFFDFAIDAPVEICLNIGWVSFRALGSVRHVNPISGRIGISFEKLTRLGKSQLRELIVELEEAERAGRTGVLEISIASHKGAPYHPLDAPDK
jgi:hypothetical protein